MDKLAVELMEAALQELRTVQKNFNSRERAIVITNLETAILWAREINSKEID